ncbi:uncharacterized protein BDV14DRAFT_49306 [Aspergillus stella-maris]|uniref:uncharacterized protein n=1 Tax=Aspergillus stella-maris TaxID=1810926 RepID=UPI003CCE07EE
MSQLIILDKRRNIDVTPHTKTTDAAKPPQPTVAALGQASTSTAASPQKAPFPSQASQLPFRPSLAAKIMTNETSNFVRDGYLARLVRASFQVDRVSVGIWLILVDRSPMFPPGCRPPRLRERTKKVTRISRNSSLLRAFRPRKVHRCGSRRSRSPGSRCRFWRQQRTYSQHGTPERRIYGPKDPTLLVL